MFKEILIFGDKKIKKNDFHRYARPLNLNDFYDLDVITVKVSEKNNNYKDFIGYHDDDYDIYPLYITLPQKTVYVKVDDNETNWMDFFTDEKFLKYYNDIWHKVLQRT